MSPETQEFISRLMVTLPVLLFSLVVHEVAHAWTADKLGDNTARMLGRITLNPIKHLDPFLSLLLPGLLIISGSPVIFGGAKPVPVVIRNLINPRRDFALVALAGPVVNILLAIICLLLLKFIFPLFAFDSAEPNYLLSLVYTGMFMNIALAVFNLIPVPPLDGSRILAWALPGSLSRFVDAIEPYGLILIFLVIGSGIPGELISLAMRFFYFLLLI